MGIILEADGGRNGLPDHISEGREMHTNPAIRFPERDRNWRIETRPAVAEQVFPLLKNLEAAGANGTEWQSFLARKIYNGA